MKFTNVEHKILQHTCPLVLRITACLSIVIIFFAVFSIPLRAEMWEWKTFTNKSHIRDLLVTDGAVWCATNGGVAKLDLLSLQWQTFTNTEGLSHNDVTQLVKDQQGRLWLGFKTGYLNVYNPAANSWKVIDDFVSHTIYALAIHGDSLFVGLDIGVSLFLINKWEVKETYKNLGDFPVEIPVNTIEIQYPYIWVGTNLGLAKSDLRYVNLMAPQSWQNYTTIDGLPSNEIISLAGIDSLLYVGTSKGCVVFDGANWRTAGSGLPASPIIQLFVYNGTVYAATTNRIYELTSEDTWRIIKGGFKKINAFAVANFNDSEKIFWVGTDGDGLYSFTSGTEQVQNYLPDGPNGNSFKDMTVDHDGNLWCASAAVNGRGFYRWDGSHWTNYSREKNNIPSDNATSIAVDFANNLWVGTWGGGVIWRSPDDELRFYNAHTGHLAGIASDTNYAVISDIAVDHNGVVWMLNYGSRSGKALVAVNVVDADTQWVYFSDSDGIITNQLRRIFVDHQNRKWIGTEFEASSEVKGIIIYDDHNTPMDKSDDEVFYLTTNEGLESNAVKAMAEDSYGIVWICTLDGLNYYLDGTIGTRYGLLTNDVRSIAVDCQDNKWIATSSGVNILDADGYRWRYYTTSNSPLVSDDVTSIAIDGRSGYVYIGTSAGLSRLETPYIAPESNLSQLKVYPNPFEIPNPQTPLKIDNLAAQVSVNIYTPSGFLVKNIPQEQILGARIVWDGRNDQGDFVASGVYLIVATTPDGSTNVTKVAVIHR